MCLNAAYQFIAFTKFLSQKIAEIWLPVCVDSLGPPISDWSFFPGHTGEKRELSLPYRRVAVGVLKRQKYMIKNTNLDKYILVLNEIWEPCCSAHSFVCKAHNETTL